jgi:hypothetical protein
MSKEKHWLKKKCIVPFFIFLCAGLLYLDGWIWGNRGDWIRFACYLTGSLMLTIITTGFLVCLKLDEISERLERVLGKQSISNNERSNSDAKELT